MHRAHQGPHERRTRRTLSLSAARSTRKKNWSRGESHSLTCRRRFSLYSSVHSTPEYSGIFTGHTAITKLYSLSHTAFLRCVSFGSIRAAGASALYSVLYGRFSRRPRVTSSLPWNDTRSDTGTGVTRARPTPQLFAKIPRFDEKLGRQCAELRSRLSPSLEENGGPRPSE